MPSDDLLERLKASLGGDEAFLWRQRLLTERLMRNITMPHERVLLHLRELIEGGYDEPSHGELADVLRFGISTIKDALGRGRKLGLIDWERQYDTRADGSRRQCANRYRLCMPQQSPQPRPDVRRHPKPKPSLKSPSSLSSLPSWSPHCGDRPLPGFETRLAAKRAEEKRHGAARWARRPP